MNVVRNDALFLYTHKASFKIERSGMRNPRNESLKCKGIFADKYIIFCLRMQERMFAC